MPYHALQPAQAGRRGRACGQATVELIGVLPLLAIVALACLQGFLLGLTVVYAQASALAASRSVAALPAARLPVPAAWRRSAQLETVDGMVRVTLAAPAVFPGAPSALMRVSAAAPAAGESQQ